MAKKGQKKTAKGRLDRFYWLAKEQGFRSRAAFKLIQLNKKFNFLEKARCCIDLCAAPGGWMQVASKQMPPNSLIVGVDLVPIKPIPRCVSFAEDINSFKCRDQLRAELKDWKADVVLHDGAPNVGTAWVQDAYTQSELVLQSLKLAVEFLAPGGHFVTKVFRSKDYNNLMWVFNQLFKRVEATKPTSSRNVSAEIFVVCQEFKAPRKIDPKFLDPQYVFKDLEPTRDENIDGDGVPQAGGSMRGTSSHNAHANVFEPEKKRRKREGYEEGDYILFKAISAQDFIRGFDPVSILGSNNQITFKTPEDKELFRYEETSEDIRANCEDLKVLGKKDFKNLMKWRLAIREQLGIEVKKPAVQEDTTEEAAQIEPLNSDDEMDAELERLTEEERKKLRKERRRRNEIRAKKVLKMQLQMTTPMDIGMEQGDETLHGGAENFSEYQSSHRGGNLNDDEGDHVDESDQEERRRVNGAAQNDEDDDDSDDELDSDEERERRLANLEGEMDGMYEDYRTHLAERDNKFRVKEQRRKNSNFAEWQGIKENDSDDDGEASGNDDEDDEDVGPAGYDAVQGRKEVEETYDSDDAEDDEEDREMESHRRRKLAADKVKQGRISGETASTSKKRKHDETRSVRPAVKEAPTKEAAVWFDNPLFKGVPGLDDADDDEDEEDEEDSEFDEDDGEDDDEEAEEAEDDDEEDVAESDSDFEVVPQDGSDDEGEWHASDINVDEEKRRFIEEHGLTTAEAVTLAHQLVNREKTKSDLIDQGFSKQNFIDKTDLPTWFLDDEGKHWKSHVPVTKEAMAALRARQRALDARPIKKIAEAKARKKYKAAQRLSKAQKKAEDLLANEDGEMTEKDKASSIAKLLAKGGAKPKQKETKLVVARGPNRGLKGRPKGVKGRFRMVDPRMKKELRAKKRVDRKAGKKTGAGWQKQKPRIPNGYGGRGP